MTTALALFSGGLDSILACRVIQDQGIKVKALKFVSPFFDYDLLARRDEYCAEILAKYGIDVELIDISESYLHMLAAPTYGYGKNFNPCVDCKILLVRAAKELMAKYEASFLITGEVIGQRPMSQRSDTLRIIERDSGTDGILLRPLCCQALKKTQAEEQGLIDPEKLPHFHGRNRTPQIELASQMGISDFPSPAGGCILTEPIRAARIQTLYNMGKEELLTPENIRFLLQGRQYLFPSGAWLTMGRNQSENILIESLQMDKDLLIKAAKKPGPSGLLRFSHNEADHQLAAAIVARYMKKDDDLAQEMRVVESDGSSDIISVRPAVDSEIKPLNW
ncbi:MAG: thiamine biosynthesis protein [Thermodesulfobacteriota bacterium]